MIIDAAKPVYPDIPLSDAASVELPKERSFWIDEIQRRMGGLR
jgi:hypothetical protein